VVGSVNTCCGATQRERNSDAILDALLLAALLGGVIGWLSYQRMRGGASSEAESRLRAEIDKFRAEAGNLRHSLTVEQDEGERLGERGCRTAR
jgi:hypothetical protein